MTAAEAFERLRPLATLRGDLHVDDEVRDSAGAIAGANLAWIKAGNRKHKDWNHTVLGTLRLQGNRLTVEVNSARRRNRIAREIAKRFGLTARIVETKVTDLVAELDARRARDGKPDRAARSRSSEPERSLELEALEAELARKHWDALDRHEGPSAGEPNAPAGVHDATRTRAARGPPGRPCAYERTQSSRRPPGR